MCVLPPSGRWDLPLISSVTNAAAFRQLTPLSLAHPCIRTGKAATRAYIYIGRSDVWRVAEGQKPMAGVNVCKLRAVDRLVRNVFKKSIGKDNQIMPPRRPTPPGNGAPWPLCRWQRFAMASGKDDQQSLLSNATQTTNPDVTPPNHTAPAGQS